MEAQKSSKIKKIYCFPGNAGTNELAENIEIDLNNFEEINFNSIPLKIMDFLGREAKIGKDIPLIYFYNNGVVIIVRNLFLISSFPLINCGSLFKSNLFKSTTQNSVH